MKLGPAVARLAQVPPVSFSAPTQNVLASLARSTSDRTSPFSPALDLLVRQSLQHYHVPGLAISVVNGNETFSRGYGIASFPDIPVTPDTMFYGASTTKAFVAAALSIIVDDDETFPHVKWQTPITRIIPNDFVLEDNYSTLHLTLEDAATHCTGLPRHDLAMQGGLQTVREVVRSMRYLPLTEPLRTTFQYCNLMYIMLGHVIETLTGRWLGDFLAGRIWSPLNMTSTYFSLSDTLQSGKPFAQGYYWRTDSQTFTEVEYIDETSMEGCGAVISSVNDYSRWIRMMIERTGPITESGHQDLITPRILEETNPVTDSYVFYGYGWEMEMYRGYEVITHNGAETGFGTTIRYIPEKRWGCVMMGNTEAQSNQIQEMLIWHLIDDLLETPNTERINMTAAIERWVALRIQIRNTTFVKELLYPADETPYLPPSLPLQAYAGVYSHPGYGEWPITYHDDTLWNKMNHTNVLRYDAQLDHITGEQFLLIGYDVGLPDDPMYIRVEFDIDGKGAVQQMGLELEYTMKGQKIWFQKVGQRPQPGGSGVLEWSFWYWVAFSAGIVLWEVLCRFWEQILWCFV